MDYEKKYKEAMERMKLCVRTGLKITPEYIFPELAESEDEKIINGLIDSLTRISLNTRTDSTSPNYTFYKEIDWLKSLKGRVQPKQEWGEEDEHRIKDTVYFLDTAKKHYASTEELDACIAWLESLKGRVRPQWKPSDNELEVLRLVAEKDGTCLMGLYEQLKKLKED